MMRRKLNDSTKANDLWHGEYFIGAISIVIAGIFFLTHHDKSASALQQIPKVFVVSALGTALSSEALGYTMSKLPKLVERYKKLRR